MRRALYTDGHEVLYDDLQETIESIRDEVVGRFGDASLDGVVSGLNVTSPIRSQVSVSTGSALIGGERAVLSTAATAEFNPTDVGFHVVLRFVTDDPVGRLTHPVTGQLKVGRTADSFEVAVVQTAEDTDVVLATITAIDDTTGIATLGTSNRKTIGVDIGLNRLDLSHLAVAGSVAVHVNDKRTGDVTSVNPHGNRPEDFGFRPDSTMPEHRKRSHAHQLVTSDPTSRSGLISFSGTTLNATQIVSGEEFVVEDTRVTTISPTSLSPSWNTAGGVLAILLGTNGTLSTVQILLYSGARTVTGVQPLYIDPESSLVGSRSLAYTVVGSRKFLSLDGGPLVEIEEPTAISNGDGFYTLYAGSVACAITFWIDYSALPVGNQTDTLTGFGSTYQTNYVTLGHVYFPPGGAGPLGYGDDGTGGLFYDTRPFGSIRLSHLDSELRTLVKRVTSEVRRDGWAFGGEQDTSPGGFIWQVKAGVVYIDGTRYLVKSLNVTCGAANTDYWIYVDSTGALVASTTDPALGTSRYARCHYVRTGAVSGFVYVRDERNVLRDLDRTMRLGCDDLTDKTTQQNPRLMIDNGPYGAARGLYRGRTLAIEGPGTLGYDTVRIYLDHWSFSPFLTNANPADKVAGLTIAINAKWKAENFTDQTALGSAVWEPDDATRDAVIYGFDGLGWYQQIKRREELQGVNPAWKDVSFFVLNPSWTNTPFQLDMENSALAVRTTEFFRRDGTLDIRERFDLDQSAINLVCPQNLVRAWGYLEVWSVAVAGTTTFKTYGRIHAGMNVGDAIYIGDGTNNLWKVPLLTRMLRYFVGEYEELIPDGIVVSSNQYDSFTLSNSDLSSPKVRLVDDGKTTAVIVKGPIVTSNSAEGSFTLGFMVVGTAADEAIPPADAIVDRDGHVQSAAVMRPDSGFATTRAEIHPFTVGAKRATDSASFGPVVPPSTQLPGPGGGLGIGDQNIEGPGEVLGLPDPGTSASVTGVPGGSGPRIVRTINGDSVVLGMDDNSMDPGASGRGPLQDPGGPGETGVGGRGTGPRPPRGRGGRSGG